MASTLAIRNASMQAWKLALSNIQGSPPCAQEMFESKPHWTSETRALTYTGSCKPETQPSPEAL
eukprot:753234-Pelagomonas_calceolata.AAC.1